MTPIFKCLICRKDIERSTKAFWIKKGHLLCSSCLDSIEKNQPNRYFEEYINFLNKNNSFLALINFSLRTKGHY